MRNWRGGRVEISKEAARKVAFLFGEGSYHMKKIVGYLLIICLLPIVQVRADDGTQGQGGVSDERFAKLARGVNLSGWFWLSQDEARFSPAEWTALREISLTYVRLPIDLSYVMDDSADLLNETNVARIEDGIQQLHAADLAVVVDLHSTDLSMTNLPYSGDLNDEVFLNVYIKFWEAFAARLEYLDPEMTFFSLVNEPQFWDDLPKWEAIQYCLVKAVRAVAPEHTIIVTSAIYSSIEALVQMTPLGDRNVVYDFHFYEPFVFTHQGAGWSWPGLRGLHDVPYPSSPEAVAPLLEEATAEQFVLLTTYGEEYWNRDKVAALIAPAAEWAELHGVRLICSEFGVFGYHAEPKSRARWIGEVREIFEGHGIGWALWEYDEGYGMAARDANGQVQFDAAILAALGLGA